MRVIRAEPNSRIVTGGPYGPASRGPKALQAEVPRAHPSTGEVGEMARELWRQIGSVAADLPRFATAPLYRSWHLRWGATDAEVAAGMPGDDLYLRGRVEAQVALRDRQFSDSIGGRSRSIEQQLILAAAPSRTMRRSPRRGLRTSEPHHREPVEPSAQPLRLHRGMSCSLYSRQPHRTLSLSPPDGKVPRRARGRLLSAESPCPRSWYTPLTAVAARRDWPARLR